MPNQEPASAWMFGNSSVRVGTQGLFRQYLKTFVPPFLLTRLTAPGSPRMVAGQHLVKTCKQKEYFQMRLCSSIASQCRAKNTFCHKTSNFKATRYSRSRSWILLTFVLPSFTEEIDPSKCGKLIQMTTGYFLRWWTSYHSFPGPTLSKMPAESVSHPGDIQDVKFPTHVHFTKSNSRGLTAPHSPNLSLGQTIQVHKTRTKMQKRIADYGSRCLRKRD